MKKNNSQSRKWQITINNPLDKGFSHEEIKDKFKHFKSLVYWCMSDEIGGEKETPHTHIFMAFKGAVRFTTIQKHFKGGYFATCKGTSLDNRDYIFAEGKHKDKEGQVFRDTHEEWGELPIEEPGKRNDLDMLYKMVKEGMSNFEILEVDAKYMMQIDRIEKVRQTFIEEQFKDKFRNLDVTYVFGKTGTGKTRDIMEADGYTSVFRVTDYDHPFDGYKGQNTVVFEEFRSSLKLSDMLNYLDGYPLELPCRYANKIACFEKVYIVSNWELEKQYENIQQDHLETWKAFLRRIDNVKEYTGTEIIEKRTDRYLEEANDFKEIKADPRVVKQLNKQTIIDKSI